MSAWLLAALLACSAPPRTTVELTVSGVEPGSHYTLETSWLGQERAEVLLADAQGQAHATLEGPPVRFLRLSLATGEDGVRTEALDRIEWLGAGTWRLHYLQSPGRSGALLPVTGPGEPSTLRRRAARLVGLHGAWLVVVTGLVAALALRQGDRSEPRWPRWASPLLWPSLAVAWTWPALLAGPDRVVGLHPDVQTTVWSLSASARLLAGGLVDPLTGWPTGAPYRGFDSYTLLLPGLLADLVDPARLHGLLQVLLVALAGWATERLALGLGARGVYAALAGVLTATSGMGAMVLLEGHIYLWPVPWLPLLALWWWRSLGPTACVRDGALAGLGFTLCLLTSGYVALAAALLVAVTGLHALARPRLLRPRPLLAAAAIALPGVFAYAALVLPGASAGRSTSLASLRTGSASLLGLVGAEPTLDLVGHSMALVLSPVGLGLLILAPTTLPPRARATGLLLAAGAGLLLALGPSLMWGPGQALFDLPWAGLSDTPLFEVVRFPIRMGWVFVICGSALAARVATRRAGSLGGAGYLLLILALVDAGLRVDLPGRQVARLGGPAIALQDGEGPVLDLLPLVPTAVDDPASLLITRAACMEQAWHGRAIADECIRTDAAGSGEALSWLQSALGGGLLDGGGPPDGSQLGRALGASGFHAVVFHPDLFRPADRVRLAAALRGLDPSPTTSTDGGQLLEVYTLDAPAVAAPAAAAPLPPTGPPPAVGAAASAPTRVSSLRIVVTGAAGIPEARVTLHLPDGRDVQAPLAVAEGRVAGTGSAALVARFAQSLPGALELEVDARAAGSWRGPVHLVQEDDLVVFEARDGALWPVAATPALPEASSSVPPRAAIAGSIAGLVLLMVGTLLLHRVRLDRAWAPRL